MKSLKLKKVKISKIGNPHILFGGAQAAQGAQQNPLPDTTGKDTKADGDCITGTNGNTIRTGPVPVDINLVHGVIQN